METLSVKVYFSIFMDKKNFSGKAKAVSSKNKVGDFDILPHHSNFVTVIRESLVIQKKDGDQLEYEFDRGVLKVSDNEVEIFLGI